jgi:hypothetical protein
MAKRDHNAVCADRVCLVCKHDFGRTGPLPYLADGHLIDNAVQLTCSPKCRAERGLLERRVTTKREVA